MVGDTDAGSSRSRPSPEARTTGHDAPTTSNREFLTMHPSAPGDHAPAGPARHGGPVPASASQRRLWFLHQLDPASPAYNITSAVRLLGEVNTDAMARALGEVVRRHEVLRTTFGVVEGGPVQVVAGAVAVPLPVTDLSGVAADLREREAAARVREEAARPFDLARGPLLRAGVLKLGPAEHVIVLNVHHAVADGLSMSVLIRELAALYGAFARGLPSPLPEPPLQYADYSLAQDEWLRGDAPRAQVDYWKTRLVGVPVLELPTDRPRPADPGRKAGSRWLTLPAPLADAMRALSRRSGVTPFMTLLAAFQVLLHRYSGQDDVVVGTPVGGRTRPEHAAMIGLFVNSLAVRTDLSGNPGFRDVLSRVRRTAAEAYARQDLPFEQVVAAAQPERDVSHAPIFQVMFVYLEESLKELHTPGLTLVPMDVDSTAAKFDLTLFATETDQGLRLKLDYDADLYDAATMDRMLGHYKTLLDGAVSDPDVPVADLAMMAEPERRLVLREWNATRADEPRETPFHRLFEAQAAGTPDADAVGFGDTRLSYRELNGRANRLAHHLRDLGVGPDVLVGLCIDRSPEMLVGLLGVLKAGGAYVPLDPGYPADRLAFMLADSGAAVVLTRSDLRNVLPEHAARTVLLDTDWPQMETRPATDPSGQSAPENLAYVIYTSGSTGKPKGAMVTHRGLVNYLRWCTQAYAVSAGGGSPVHSSVSFDLTVTGLFAPLLCGRRVDLLPDEQGAEALGEALRRTGGYSLVKITPAHLLLLAQQLAPHEAAGRTHAFVVGGEQLTDEHLDFWRENAPDTLIVNEYGPTETVVGCCVYRVPRGGKVAGAVPIGRPIANTQLYILDARMRPTPVGVPGELFVGGDGVARGYLSRPALTAEKFVPDPFGTPGARLYRTGDRARWRADGQMEFLGRADDQVKIRGYRVEPGEVEAALARHPTVREAAVTVREDAPGDRRLVGYVVAAPGHEAEADSLRRDLARSLPAYMVPSAVVVVDALPLTPNGKVDRKALPATERRRDAATAGPGVAAGPLEEKLARIVAETLNHASVGVDENLFDLGIDSILVIQVVSRARQAGLRLNPGQVFRHPTVAGLAGVVRPFETVEAEQGLVVGRVLLTPIQRWFFEQDLVDPHHFNQSLLLEIAPEVDPDRLRQAVAVLVEHHDALRQRFTPEASGWRQEAAPPVGEDVPFARVDLTAVAEAEQLRALEAEAARVQASLHLARGPVLRFTFFHLGHGRPARMLMAAHHLVVDGVSWRVLLEDLAALLGPPGGDPAEAALPPKTTSFRQWAELLTRHARSTELTAERDFWLAQATAHAEPLPTDLGAGRDPGTVGEAAVVSVSLDEGETRALLQEVPRALHSQINDALLAALASTLSDWTGRDEVLIDLEGHGREEIVDGVDLTRTVGWFTTLFPVRLVLPADREPGSALKAVKEQLRAVPRRGIGYGLLRYLNDDPAVSGPLRAAPRCEVAFNYLGQLDQALPASTGLAPARESAGPARAPGGRRAHLLDVLGLVAGGRFRFDWTYNPGVHRRETVERLAGAFLRSLRELVALARSPEVRGYSPSDFPLAGLDQATLDRAFAGEPGVEDVYPLSPMQEGMLFHAAYAPESGAYVQQWTCTLRGDFDATVFEAAWRQVIARHPVLRTSFRWVDSERPVQVVHRAVDAPVQEIDWRGADSDEQERRFAGLLKDDRRRGFVASTAPLVRLTLVRVGDTDSRLLLTYHHLILDGWCMPVVFGEALALYEAGRAGREARLPERRPYRDYIAWLKAQDLVRSEAYWRGVLSGFRAPTPLGLDGASVPAAGEGARGERFARLPAAPTDALRGLSREHGLTLNTVVQGAWALLLSRYGGEADVVFGVTVSGRQADLAGVEGMVGLFINTLPARVRVEESSPLVPWLKGVQARQVEMREHEHSPLVLIQGWSDVPRGRPLFESLVVFENYPTDASLGARAGGLGIMPDRIREQTDFPLALMVAPGAELALRVDYDARRFDPGAVDRLLTHFQNLLAEFAADPARRLADLPMMSREEQDSLLRLAGTAEESATDGDPAGPGSGLDIEGLGDDELDLMIQRLSGETGSFD